MSTQPCRACHSPVSETFCDLGQQPIANKLVSQTAPAHAEILHPLRPLVCGECFLVQLPEIERPQFIFSDYSYFSSYSDTWLAHVAAYADVMVRRFALSPSSKVIELASNDGHLLSCFQSRGIPVLGIEPAENVALVARAAGVPTLARFFGRSLAQELQNAGERADLLVANNVLAHVPDLHDFVAGMQLLLAPSGVATLEFPHLLRLLQKTQFDTIYHEHYSYFSLAVVEAVLHEHGLRVFDVEELPTHGGSLRVYACHDNAGGRAERPPLARLRELEANAGMNRLETFLSFQRDVERCKTALLELLHDLGGRGIQVAGYGAPAKATTLLNFCGVGPEMLAYTVDRSPHKQGLSIPGVRVPIHGVERLRETRPGCVLILAWNLAAEVMRQVGYIGEWGGRFAVPIPRAGMVR